MENDFLKIVRPRLNDYYGIPLLQEKVDFAIPYLGEDIPLYLDPFMLWKSPSQADYGLHAGLIQSFNALGNQWLKGNTDAVEVLMEASECNAVGLGNSGHKTGHRFGEGMAKEILSLFLDIPQLRENGFAHFEEVQLLVENVSKDRISDIACNLLGSHLVDYTIYNCHMHGIPTEKVAMSIFDAKKCRFELEEVELPIDPMTEKPMWLVPKRWLRKMPWMNPDDFVTKFYKSQTEEQKDRGQILLYNRHNYGLVKQYIERKELSARDCQSDPLFTQIPVLSAKRKMKEILSLPTGKEGNADKKYEAIVAQLMASMLYPHLDFAQAQSRTESGAQIRDLIFYNNKSEDFFKDVYEKYGSKQIVFEMKNVASLEREHVNQLHRYLSNTFGRFGVIITRNEPSKSIMQNIIDLWSGQRVCILVLTDKDLQRMTNIYDNKQRYPYEYLNMLYVDQHRKYPS